MKKSNLLIYLIFFVLLGVLLPHTAWFFHQFEDQGSTWGLISAWAAALAFESTIAVFTHKLARHLEGVGRRGSSKPWARFRLLYLNAYGLGLFVAWVISTVANYAHAKTFSQLDPGFTLNSLGPILAGGILPFCSLLFARAISAAVVAEPEADENEARLNRELREAKQIIQELKGRLDDANQYAALGSPVKKDAILWAAGRWPALSQEAVAVITGSSKAHVSTILKSQNGAGGAS